MTPPEPPKARRTTRWLPWLLVAVIVIPLVRSCIRTRAGTVTSIDSIAAPASVAPDTGFIPAPAATPSHEGEGARAEHRKAKHPDSVKRRESLGEKIDKLGGGPEAATPPGQGAMGGEGRSGQAPGGKVTPEKPPTTEGVMGGDGPRGKQ